MRAALTAPLVVEMALSTPNFLTCSLWAVNTVIAEEARGDGHHLRKLTRRRRKSSQPRLCQVWLHRGEGGEQVILLTRAGEGVACADRGRQPVNAVSACR